MARLPENIQAALEKLEPLIRQAFIEAIADIRSNAQLAVVVRALEQGRIDDAIRALSIDANAFGALDDAIRGAYLLGGRDAIAALPVIPDPAGLGKS